MIRLANVDAVSSAPPLRLAEKRFARVPRGLAQDVVLAFAGGEREGGEDVGDKVEEEDLQGEEGQRQSRHYRERNDHHLADIAREEIDQEPPEIAEDDAALADRRDNAAEGVIAEHDVGRLARDLRAA